MAFSISEMSECTLKGGVAFLNKCLKRMGFAETPANARETCKGRGESLLMLDSVQESKFMDDLLRYGSAWVGATYSVEDNVLLWDDGKEK